jgi:hypothetical protein
MDISVAFGRIVELGSYTAKMPLPHHYEWCWEFDVGRFHVAMNGHAEEKAAQCGAKVPRWSALVLYNGFPVGIINPRGGVLLAGAEEDLIVELEKAILATGHELETC